MGKGLCAVPFRSIGGWLRSVPLLFGPRAAVCLYCGELGSGGTERFGLCRSCYSHLPWIADIQCETCGRSETCPDCLRRPDRQFVASRSAVHYNAPMKELLARYKYRGDEKLAGVMGGMLGYAYQQILRMHPLPKGMQQFLTFVPLSEQRLSERGFNQAEQLAVEAGIRTGLPVIDLLQRLRHTDKQSFKSRHARLRDLEQVFSTKPIATPELFLHGTFRLYIVDDVYTTGSTLQQCASTLRERYPQAQIFGLMWAR